MHSIVTRINNASAMLSTCVMTLLAAIALSSFVFQADPKGEILVSSIKVFPAKAPRYMSKRQDYTFVDFNVTADLTPLFNWNTKQLFVYLGAEYENAGIKNDVVLWDKIVRRKEDAHINFAGKNKYMFKDIAMSFKNATPAAYTLKYNVMPYVGLLTFGEAARTVEGIKFPPSQKKGL